MSTQSIDYQFILESDSTPLIIFDNRGRILYPNNAAEIVLGYVTSKELFDLAMLHAPTDFGSKTTLMDLHYKQLSFYAINVSYNSEDWIALRLYYRPAIQDKKRLNIKKLIDSDINTLLEATLTMYKMSYQGKLMLFTDKDIPTLKIDQNSFSKLLRKVLNLFKSSNKIEISLKVAIGEYVVVDEHRYKILRLEISGDYRGVSQDKHIIQLCEEMQITATIDSKKIVLDIPFIQ